MKKEATNRLAEIQAKQDIQNFEAQLNRARSITVGTSFGGTTELMMRGNDGSVLWCPMQPVEIIELIHQLASNVGCHLALKPRDDFASWRDWRVGDEEKKSLNGWAPFVNDMAPHNYRGQPTQQSLLPENQPGLNPMKESDHESAMATKKTVDKRSTKRASKAP